MAIQVQGTLTDPLGNILATDVKITAENSNVAVKGSHGIVTTGVDGSYNFNLEEGVFLVQVLQKKEYSEGVSILVDAGTPSPITLGTLLKNHEVPVVI
jgi:VCBS repeat-containing protein